MYIVAGPTSVLPLFCLSSILFSTQSPTQRPVDPKVARSITPAVVLGFVAPTMAALLPTRNAEIRRLVVTVWQAYPLLCVAFTQALAATLTGRESSIVPVEAENKADKAVDYATDAELQFYKNEDVAPLKFTQGAALLACVAIPIIAKPASAVVGHVFGEWAEKDLPQILVLAQDTGVISAATGLVYSLYTAWDLRSLGFVRTKQAILGGLASLAALSLAGPGAMIAGISYWRECSVSGLSAELH